jgi:hypothetical protein
LPLLGKKPWSFPRGAFFQKRNTQLPVFGIYNLFPKEILGEVIFKKEMNNDLRSLLERQLLSYKYLLGIQEDSAIRKEITQ